MTTTTIVTTEGQRRLAERARPALELALEALRVSAPVQATDSSRHLDAIEACRAALSGEREERTIPRPSVVLLRLTDSGPHTSHIGPVRQIAWMLYLNDVALKSHQFRILWDSVPSEPRLRSEFGELRLLGERIARALGTTLVHAREKEKT